MVTLTQTQADTLRRAAYSVDARVTAYSGRAMYGDVCLGVVLEDVGEAFRFALAVHDRDTLLADILADTSSRSDSLGRDSIVLYWPRIDPHHTDLTDDDEEEQD